MSGEPLSIAITGAGGAGVISCGDILLRAWAACGGYGLLRKAFGPQIRGGEAAALLQLTENETYTAATHYDVILALDWINFERFEDEIRTAPHTLILCQDESAIPGALQYGQSIQVDFRELASTSHVEARMNMVAVGLLGKLLGLPSKALLDRIVRHLGNKAAAYQEGAKAAMMTGYEHSIGTGVDTPARKAEHCWCITGNQAAGYGALASGVRFAAAYPITPASDALEWLAGGLELAGGHLIQAEDELAAINMTIGAAFGGVPAFTATSGPGLSLMSESLGLAVASETPLTLLNVMRGGPSTGIPTKSEQSDLNIALHGVHGDAPHLVLAALDVADCAFTTSWAVSLAQHLQTPAIVLSDQFLGQSTAVVTRPRLAPKPPPHQAPTRDTDYLRYRLTDSGISTLAWPGDPDSRFTADGLEHNQRGTPSSRESDHRQQLDKRQHKLSGFEFGADWAQCEGNGDTALLCFGSTSTAVRQAAEQLRQRGLEVRSVALRLLAPVPALQLEQALAGCTRVLLVEQNHSAQLYHYLRGHCDLPLESLALPGPVPITAARIVDQLLARQTA